MSHQTRFKLFIDEVSARPGIREVTEDGADKCSFFRDDAAALAELTAILQTPLCRECGDHVGLLRKWWGTALGARLEAAQRCFTCDYWTILCERYEGIGDAIISNGYHLTDAGNRENVKNKASLGFGGAEMTFRMHSGRVVKSNNIWCQGKIPLRFRPRLPDNATREKGQ